MSAPALALAALLAAAPPPATGDGRPKPGPDDVRSCIQLSNSSSTSYHPIDDHTIIVESAGRWYRLTTTPSSLMLQPDSFFVNEIYGPSTLCSRLDFQLYVAQPPGLREGIIVQRFEQIPPEEGRGLRPRFRR